MARVMQWPSWWGGRVQKLDEESPPLEAQRLQWKRDDPQRKAESVFPKDGEMVDSYRTQ